MTASILATRGIQKASNEALRALLETARDLGFNPDYLAAVISFETGGTWSPSVPNAAGSGAVGLIQFMPSTARNLGTSTAALAAMTDAEQMKYVRKYLESVGVRSGRVRSLSDLYMAVFTPSAIGKPEDYVLYSSPSTAYKQNAGLDRGGKGYITKSDAAGAVQGVYTAAGGQRIQVLDAPDMPAPGPDGEVEPYYADETAEPQSKLVPLILGMTAGAVVYLWWAESRQGKQFATAFAKATSW